MRPDQSMANGQPRGRAARGAFTLSDAVLAFAAPRVLLAEDDARMRDLMASALRRDGLDVIEAEDGAELLDLIARFVLRGDARPVDLIVSDVRMPRWNGLEVLAGLRRADWATPMILVTAFGDQALHDEARRLGAAAVFDKPFDLDDLRTAALHHARR